MSVIDKIFRNKRREVIAFFSDTQAGGADSLCPSDIALYKFDIDGEPHEWYPTLTPAQVRLWNRYEDNIEEVVDFAEGDPLTVVHLGDICQGDKWGRELMTSSKANQVLIAIGIMNEWLELPNLKRVRLISGTDVHEFGEHSAVQLVTSSLQSDHPDHDIRWYHHGLANLGGFDIDFAHHGPGKGKRKWLEMSNAGWYLRDIVFKEIFEGRRPPRLVIRAHKHLFGMGSVSFFTGEGLVRSDIIILPPYQAMSIYARRVSLSEHLVHHGMVAVEVIDGELGRIMPFVKQYDVRTREVWNEG